MNEIVNVKDRLPNVECGSFLVYAPKSFPKNSRWLVAEYYDDVKGFYSESGENFLEDVTHWCTLPDEPNGSVCKKCGVVFMPRLFKELVICDRCHDELLSNGI